MPHNLYQVFIHEATITGELASGIFANRFWQHNMFLQIS